MCHASPVFRILSVFVFGVSFFIFGFHFRYPVITILRSGYAFCGSCDRIVLRTKKGTEQNRTEEKNNETPKQKMNTETPDKKRKERAETVYPSYLSPRTKQQDTSLTKTKEKRKKKRTQPPDSGSLTPHTGVYQIEYLSFDLDVWLWLLPIPNATNHMPHATSHQRHIETQEHRETNNKQ